MNFGFRFKDEDILETVDPQIISQRIEERKKVEESDHQLTNDLFSSSPNESCKELQYVKPPKYPKKTLKIDVAMVNNLYKKHGIKYSKTTSVKEKEIYDDSSFDDIDELACKIEESYSSLL